MVFQGERCFAKHGRDLRAWTFWGYVDAFNYFDLAMYDIWLLTPPTTLQSSKPAISPSGIRRSEPRRADRWLDPAGALAISPKMRANYKMQRLYLEGSLAAGQAIEPTQQQSHYWRMC